MSFWLSPITDRPASVAGGVASNTDILRAAAESMRLVDNSNSALEALNEGYEEWRRRFKAGTGQDAPPNPLVADFSREDPRARAMGWLNASDEARIVEQQRTEFAQFINEQAARFPAEAVREWAQFDPGQYAVNLARSADADLATKMESRDGWDKFIPAFAGAAGGSLRDPIQLGSLFLGGGAGGARTVLGRILMTAGTEAGVNAATEAALQPSVQDWRRRAGLDNGFDQALTNIAFAGVLGGVFGAGGRGLIEVLERQPAGAAVRAALPPDVRGALDAADTLQVTAAQKPESVSAGVFDRLTAQADAVVQRPEAPIPPAPIDQLQVARVVDGLAPEGQSSRVDMTGTLDLIRTGDTPDTAPSRPVLRFVASIGGVDPNSPIGAELQAVGITSQSMPGIFRKGGRQAIDNVPITEAQAAFPGRTDLDDGNGYVRPQAFIDAMTSEVERRGEAVGAAADARRHFEGRGVDFNDTDETILSRMADVDDVDRRYFSQGPNARAETVDLVHEALELAGGPVSDAVIRAAVDLHRLEGEDLATAVEWAMSDAAGVSRSTPAVDADFDVGTRAPDPEEFDALADLDAEGDDWAAELEALREIDPDLANQLEADFSATIDKPAALQRVVDACPF